MQHLNQFDIVSLKHKIVFVKQPISKNHDPNIEKIKK